MKRNLFRAVALMAALLCVPAQPAQAQVAVYDAANYVKNTLTELHTLQIVTDQATQIANQLQQIDYQVQSLRNFPNGIWGQIQGDLQALTQIAKVGQSISYGDANLSTEFTHMYPGYEVPTNYTQAYTQWGSNALGGMQGALQSAGLQSTQFQSEDALFSQLQGLSNGSVGQMQALQVGNMISIQEVQQLEKLRQLQMAQAPRRVRLPGDAAAERSGEVRNAARVAGQPAKLQVQRVAFVMQRITRAASLLFFLALLPIAALADSQPVCVPGAGQGGILTGLAHQFSTTTQPWMTTALHYAQGLFFALVAIEIAWSAITYVLQKDSLPDFVASLLLKILGVGFFFIVLQPQYGPVWIGDIISSFSQAGSAISGQVQLTPSDPSSVFNCGTDIANAMLESTSENQGMTLGNLLPMIEIVLTSMICALGVVLAFAIIAGQLLITLIESYIVIGAGVFMLGFTGSRWTLVFGEKYVGYAVSIGIKLFMLELIVGLGFDTRTAVGVTVR